ncbi:hypothetical protein J1N35_043847 [Gossypium stocksii]|uniref:Uncharacterized protein n=1 Tax=Gossypium stocksii TaxID=47602 RepID=A0A9D3ZFV6_9ROSI|nr:hypothetical protein J1N35_043847 [Gossypium stocksii]
MYPEKGFTMNESNYRDFMARICQVAEALNWELFCEKRPRVDEELVYEFYANLTSSELTEVPVHRIKVSINSNPINEFFELPNFKNNEYFSLLSNLKPKIYKKFSRNLQFQVPSGLCQSKESTHVKENIGHHLRMYGSISSVSALCLVRMGLQSH